jgi:hypothetical protein
MPDDLKASVAASREACEMLRAMRPATVNQAAQRRDLAEREAVILDKMTDLAQALFQLRLRGQPQRCPPPRHHLASGERGTRARDRDQLRLGDLRPGLTAARPAGHSAGRSGTAEGLERASRGQE